MFLLAFIWAILKPSPVPKYKINHDKIVDDIRKELAPIRLQIHRLNQGNNLALMKLDSLKAQTPAMKKEFEKIKQELENNTVVIQNEDLDELIVNIEKIYRSKLRENSDDDSEQSVQNFKMSKEIVEAVSYFNTHDPEILSKLKDKIEKYLGDLNRLNIRDKQMRGQEGFNLFLTSLYLPFMFPVFLVGYIINYPPYKLTGIMAIKLVNSDDFKGSLQLASSMIIFLVIYLGWAVGVSLFFGKLAALGFFCLAYPAGMHALHYARQFYRLKSNLRFMKLFMTDVKRLTNLSVVREQIIEELEGGRKIYLETKDESTTA